MRIFPDQSLHESQILCLTESILATLTRYPDWRPAPAQLVGGELTEKMPPSAPESPSTENVPLNEVSPEKEKNTDVTNNDDGSAIISVSAETEEDSQDL